MVSVSTADTNSKTELNVARFEVPTAVRMWKSY
jgi:hypothetical protein